MQGSKGGDVDMRTFRTFMVAVSVIALTVAPAFAKGGGGGGAGGGGGVGGGGGGGNAVGLGQGNAPESGVTPGAGRGTAISAPGSQHRSDRATQNLAAPTPGKADPSSGVIPGGGRVGTV